MITSDNTQITHLLLLIQEMMMQRCPELLTACLIPMYGIVWLVAKMFQGSSVSSTQIAILSRKTCPLVCHSFSRALGSEEPGNPQQPFSSWVNLVTSSCACALPDRRFKDYQQNWRIKAGLSSIHLFYCVATKGLPWCVGYLHWPMHCETYVVPRALPVIKIFLVSILESPILC